MSSAVERTNLRQVAVFQYARYSERLVSPWTTFRLSSLILINETEYNITLLKRDKKNTAVVSQPPC